MTEKSDSGTARAGASGAVSASVRRDIDENLKRVYESALEPEIPDRFKELLAKLKAGGQP